MEKVSLEKNTKPKHQANKQESTKIDLPGNVMHVSFIGKSFIRKEEFIGKVPMKRDFSNEKKKSSVSICVQDEVKPKISRSLRSRRQ